MVPASDTNTRKVTQYILIVDDLHNLSATILNMVVKHPGIIVVDKDFDLSFTGVSESTNIDRRFLDLIELVPANIPVFEYLKCFFDCTINYILCLQITAVILLLVLQHTVTVETIPMRYIRIRSPTRSSLFL